MNNPKLIYKKSNRADIKKYQPHEFLRNCWLVKVIKLQIQPKLPKTRMTYGTEHISECVNAVTDAVSI